MKKIFQILFIFCLSSQPVMADAGTNLEADVQELKRLVQELKATVASQQKEIASLKSQSAATVPVPAPSSSVSTAPGVSPSTRISDGRWNPEMGVVADTVLKLDSPSADEEGADRISVRELELILGSAVDPYSRLDVSLSFSDFEEAGLEEGYYTHYGLPWDMTARLGRFKPNIGKALPTHRDSLDTVDEPLVIQRYFGLEGYSKTGVDIKKTLDLPLDSAHQISLGVLEGGNGEDGTLFGQTRRHPTLYSHLKNFWDINDMTGLELGISHLAGSRDDDSAFEVNVLGLDATLIYRYADRRHLKLQAEAFGVNRTESFFENTDDDGNPIFNDQDDARHLWGGYLLLDWRIDPLWAAGFRWDRVQLVDDVVTNPDSADQGYTGYITFYQSEFARWRAQASHYDLSTGGDDDQIMIQGTFSIGEHKHKLQ